MLRSRSWLLGLALTFAVASPVEVLAADNDKDSGKHDTAKGAAAGAAIGHEVGSGHAVAGSAIGAAIGHHEKNKAREEQKENK